MTEKRRVYLAGPIAGLSYEQAKDGWRGALARALDQKYLGDHRWNLTLLSPMREKMWLEGVMSLAHDPGMAHTKQIMARDFDDVRRADMIVVGLHEESKRVSIGTMIELGYAKAHQKPILIISDISRGLGIHNHGWVKELADFTAFTVEEAAHFIHAFCSEGL